MTNLDITDVLTWDQEICSELRECQGAEQRLEQLYEGLISAESPDIAFVAQMLRADEQHHSDLLMAIYNTIQASDGRVVSGSTVPHVPSRRKNLGELEGRIRRLVALERQDAKHLERLERDLRPVRETTLWPLIAEIIAADAKKHVAMLKFLSKHLKGVFD